MVVKANINEVNIPRVLVGQAVDIRLDALPGQSFQGTVIGIATQGVKTENIVTYGVTIAIDTPHKVPQAHAHRQCRHRHQTIGGRPHDSFGSPSCRKR